MSFLSVYMRRSTSGGSPEYTDINEWWWLGVIPRHKGLEGVTQYLLIDSILEIWCAIARFSYGLSK